MQCGWDHLHLGAQSLSSVRGYNWKTTPTIVAELIRVSLLSMSATISTLLETK
jgi:hypothetical protein